MLQVMALLAASGQLQLAILMLPNPEVDAGLRVAVLMQVCQIWLPLCRA